MSKFGNGLNGHVQDPSRLLGLFAIPIIPTTMTHTITGRKRIGHGMLNSLVWLAVEPVKKVTAIPLFPCLKPNLPGQVGRLTLPVPRGTVGARGVCLCPKRLV